MTNVAQMGHQCELGTSVDHATGDSAAATQPFAFKSEGVRKQQAIVTRDVTRGTRSVTGPDARFEPYTVSGPLVLEPTPEELALWLPRILGGAAAVPFPLAETLPWFNLVIDRKSKVFTYLHCKVAKATFSCSKGQILQVAMEIVGKTESIGAAGSFPAISPAYTSPFIFHDFVVTLAGSARQTKDFELTVDNQLVTDRFMNSETLTDIPEGERIITVKTNHGYTINNTDLHDQLIAGAAATIVGTNGNYSITFTLPRLVANRESPGVGDKSEIPLTLNMQALATAANNEMTITLDSTP